MRSPQEIIALMARETRVSVGDVPRRVGSAAVPDAGHVFAHGQFAMRTETGYAFHYRPGEGVAIEAAPGADPDERELWLNGSVYAAIACLNGLYPLHASAVAHNGAVHAFTGPSGAGKSTLVAGLGGRGLPMFCDDTLLLVLDDPAQLVALPGHKRLKLTDSGLAFSGARPVARVGAATQKHYALPPAGSVGTALPLASLTFLAEGGPAGRKTIAGAARFAALETDHYTHDLYLEARTPSLAALFALRSRLAAALDLAILTRPFGAAGFAKSLDLAEEAIRKHGTEGGA